MARKIQCDTSLPSNFSAISNWNSFAIKSFTSWIFISCMELDVSFSPMVVNKQQNNKTKNKQDQFHTVTSSLGQFMGGMNNVRIKHGIFTVIPQRDWLTKKTTGVWLVQVIFAREIRRFGLTFPLEGFLKLWWRIGRISSCGKFGVTDLCFLPVVSQLPDIMETKRRRFEPYVWSRDDIVCFTSNTIMTDVIIIPCRNTSTRILH